jgi:hypothetical protein
MAYTLIASNTTGGSTITFNNIPQTYKDLHLFISGQSDTGTSAAVYLQFNDDAAGYYAYGVYADDTVFVSGYWNNKDIGYISGTGAGVDRNGQADIYIPEYSLTNRKKQYQGISTTGMANTSSNNGRFTLLMQNRYNYTTAISKITVTLGSGNFTSKTKIHLFGVS